ncbi:mitochondrial import inner membrane translocase subunit Tim21 [Trichonephila inaurata madagascariensis]|uniref:Mitochondrial import inner membrane translocase subunit Tim21 n=1 Tax=Trichonephila inaurata madagascariensis TaxID=2747483 RepID=A0A8X7C3V7_9ARAC|nr:mitochondrial import inner membrane translocase subunit Tim21 [Trichonephila inaurata madagascariensis]
MNAILLLFSPREIALYHTRLALIIYFGSFTFSLHLIFSVCLEMLSRMHLISPSSWSLKFKNVSCSPSRFPSKEATFCLKQYPSILIHCRWKAGNGDQDSSLSKLRESENSQMTLAKKVKETTKDAGYLGIIVAGIGVTGVMFYAILRELFSRQSPNSVYSDALKLCRSDPSVIDTLGEPIKGYGELSSRGRRRHVSHLEYEKDGKNYMRMKFYLEGSRKSGTVHLEMVEGENLKYEYRYLFVDIDGFPPRSIILKDNRHLNNSVNNFMEYKI